MSGKSIPTDPVIIIGAGLSGLYAATTLAEKKVPVLLLEAQDRVGGRTYTETYEISGSGSVKVDQGAGYVGSSQHVVQGLCTRFNIETQKVPGKFFGSKTKFTFSLGGEVRHSTSPLASLYDYLSPLEFFAAVVTIIKTWSLGRTIPCDSPWTSKNATKWDAMTYDNWLDQCFPRIGGHFEKARKIFEFVSRTPLGIEPPETSLLYFLWYIRSADNLFSLLFFAQDKFVVGGTQQISQNLQKTLDPASVKLSHEVTHIDHDPKTKTVTVVANLQEFSGDRVILAITPHLRSRLTYAPLVSPMHNQICQRSPMGTTIKSHLYYSQPIWLNDGYNGNCSIFDGNSVSQVYDVTEPGSKNYCLQGFYVGNAGRRAAAESPEWRKQDMMKEMKRVFGGNEAYLQPTGYSDFTWDNHTYVGGAPVGTCSTGTLTNFGKALRSPTESGKLHYAGTETSGHWVGYMEGALRAGQRAAFELLDEYGVEHDEIPEPDNSLSPEALQSLHQFMKYGAAAARKISRVSTMAEMVKAKYGEKLVATLLINNEDFDNTDDWLTNYSQQNPDDVAAIYEGIEKLESFKKILLAA